MYSPVDMKTKACLEKDVLKSHLAVSLSFNPFPNNPWFLSVGSTSLFKISMEKGKIARNE